MTLTLTLDRDEGTPFQERGRILSGLPPLSLGRGYQGWGSGVGWQGIRGWYPQPPGCGQGTHTPAGAQSPRGEEGHGSPLWSAYLPCPYAHKCTHTNARTQMHADSFRRGEKRGQGNEKKGGYEPHPTPHGIHERFSRHQSKNEPGHAFALPCPMHSPGWTPWAAVPLSSVSAAFPSLSDRLETPEHCPL